MAYALIIVNWDPPPHGATQGLPGDLDITFFLKCPG